MANRSIIIIGFIIIIELFFGLLFVVYQFSPVAPIEATKGVVEYKDFVAILLSAISVILTAVTVVLALAAIWGYQTFKSRVDSVENVSNQTLITVKDLENKFSSKKDGDEIVNALGSTDKTEEN